MDRRESLKSLLIGGLAGSALLGSGCQTEAAPQEVETSSFPVYGRTPSEIERDEKLLQEVYLNEHELATIAVLCDIILPASDTAGSASEAEVPEFIEFIVKDLPRHQLPMRGGLMWLDQESNSRFNKVFIDCTDEEQIAIVEDIAYPDPDGKKPLMSHGIKFFDLMRNLTLTGYYTSKMGIEDLGYKGNMPNVWDGVPEDVLAKHDVDYDPEWLAKCIDQSTRGTTAEWDDDMNLIT
ncbi:MAG: gluconate 2-dehydrogenase subunit 3 family protein [Bacteroidota bacterium]